VSFSKVAEAAAQKILCRLRMLFVPLSIENAEIPDRPKHPVDQ
jgi:hypothetical protein